MGKLETEIIKPKKMNRISILILFLTCFVFSKDIEAQAVKVPFTKEIIKEYGLNEEWKLNQQVTKL